jgi:hypothetical protein
MSSNITQNRHARRKLEEALATLLEKAIAYDGAHVSWKTRELLAQAREYARAFNRIETMRGPK